MVYNYNQKEGNDPNKEMEDIIMEHYLIRFNKNYMWIQKAELERILSRPDFYDDIELLKITDDDINVNGCVLLCTIKGSTRVFRVATYTEYNYLLKLGVDYWWVNKDSVFCLEPDIEDTLDSEYEQQELFEEQ